MEPVGLIIVGVVILAGILLSVFLPGPLLCVGAVLVWAVMTGGTLAWSVLAASVVVWGMGAIARWLLPGQRLARSGVPKSTLFAGVVLGVVGFFVVPVVGLFLGFVLGVYLAEFQRVGGHGRAWPSTVEALKAVGLSVLIETGTAVVIGALWLAAVLLG